MQRPLFMKTLRSTFWCALALAYGLHAFSVLAEDAKLSPEYLSTLRSGDVCKLREALDHSASVNARDAQGNTPLLHAAVYGDVACVKLLLDRGADVNAVNAVGSTALLRGATDGDKVALLVEHGANVNAISALGYTPLMVAARTADSHRAVEVLLEHGASVNATNHDGATALMAAAAGGDVQTAKLLLKHGADANAQPGVGPQHFLFGGARSPLMWGAFRGDTAMMKLLVKAGAQVNAEGSVGTPLSQAAWADRTDAAKWLIAHGADVNQMTHMDGFTPLHWAASTEGSDAKLVKLLLKNGANPNVGGGAHIDAFMDVQQTPLMVARRRGDTDVLKALLSNGATNETPDGAKTLMPPARELPKTLDNATVRASLKQAVPLLQETSIVSKKSFVNHASKQNCNSCHQQALPLAAIGLAKKQNVPLDTEAEQALVKMMGNGEMGMFETDWVPVFHPDAVFTKGYALFGYANANLPADEFTDASVNHLAAIQGKDGQWYNNLPRPPLQSDDIGATALAIHALQKYPLPGRQAEFAKRVERARKWLWTVNPSNQEGRIYQLLGLAWAGEPAVKLQSLAKALIAEQHADGGWAQLPKLNSDAYATGQAIYALRVAAGLSNAQASVDQGRRYLLKTQLEDGTWYVKRRAFPFQPTMNSGFPHGRDSWISAAGTSWAVMALSLPDEGGAIAKK